MVGITFTPVLAAVNEIVWKKFFADDSQRYPSFPAVDDNGNVIIVGKTQDGPAFIRKLSGGGRALWYREVNVSGDEAALWDVAVDSDGYIYVVGERTDGPYPFIAKYGPKGGHHWTRPLSKGIFGRIAGVDVGPGGNIYIIGNIHGSMPNMPRSSPNINAFIRKYNPEGKIYWTRQFSVNDFKSATIAFGVAVGPGGGVYVVGQDDVRSRRSDGLFLRKYSPRGGVYWTRHVHSRVDWDYVSGIAVDRAGEIVITTSYAEQYSGAIKYTRKGERLWTRIWSRHTTSGVTVDSDRNVYVVGYKSDDRAYIRMYSPGGIRLRTRYFANGAATGVAADSDNNLYVTGLKYGENPASFLSKFQGPTGLCKNTLSFLCL